MSWSLLLVISAFAGLVLALPLVRAWRETGKLALVSHREAGALSQLVAVCAMGFLAGGFAYAIVYGAMGASFFGGPEPVGPRAWAGLAVMGLGTAIIALAQRQMGDSWRIGLDDQRTELVDSGLYNLVRHPIYSGLLLWLIGLVLFAPTPVLMIGAMMLTAGVSVQARLEEQHMLAQHGERYRERVARLGRFLPGIGGDLRPLPSPLWMALTLALLAVASLDLLQVVWLPYQHPGPLGGAVLYLALAWGAWRQARWAALIPAVVPLLPISILVLSLSGASVGVRPNTAMVVILAFQLAAGALGVLTQRERGGGGV